MPFFSREELECRCGCGMLTQPDFTEKLETLRGLYGAPLRVASAARCPMHNNVVSGTGRTGPHTTGRAVDFAVQGSDAYRLLRVAFDSGMFSGYGINQKGNGRFLHLDDLLDAPGRPRPTLWSY